MRLAMTSRAAYESEGRGSQTVWAGEILTDSPPLAELPSLTVEPNGAPETRDRALFTHLEPGPAQLSTKAGQDVGRSPAGDEATR
jgi:hypothetical protein